MRILITAALSLLLTGCAGSPDAAATPAPSGTTSSTGARATLPAAARATVPMPAASPAATPSPVATTDEGASEPRRNPLLQLGEPPLPATPENLTLERLSRLGFPIGDIWVYTPLTDPDNLIGQPDQYVAKLVFQDTRLEVRGDPASGDNGGAIEVYPDPALAARQREHLQGTEARMPALAEYVYQNDRVLLRVSKRLTHEQASEYEQALQTVDVPGD